MTDKYTIMFYMLNTFYLTIVIGMVLGFYIFLGSYFLILTIMCVPIWIAGELYGQEKSNLEPTRRD